MTFEEKLNHFRKELKHAGAFIMEIREDRDTRVTVKEEYRGEVMANLTLSYRHIEDASMRIGKVLQALNGGVSVYDKNVVGTPAEEEDKLDQKTAEDQQVKNDIDEGIKEEV